MVSNGMRRCRTCDEIKSLVEFYKDERSRSGRMWDCIPCKIKRQKELYRKNRQERLAYEKKRAQDPKRKAYVARKQAEWRTRNPERYKARVAVGNAVRDGRLKKGPCEVCGGRRRIQAHHDDYSKPLDVRWLCFKHHREREHRSTSWLGRL